MKKGSFGKGWVRHWGAMAISREMKAVGRRKGTHSRGPGQLAGSGLGDSSEAAAEGGCARAELESGSWACASETSSSAGAWRAVPGARFSGFPVCGHCLKPRSWTRPPGDSMFLWKGGWGQVPHWFLGSSPRGRDTTAWTGHLWWSQPVGAHCSSVFGVGGSVPRCPRNCLLARNPRCGNS